MSCQKYGYHVYEMSRGRRVLSSNSPSEVSRFADEHAGTYEDPDAPMYIAISVSGSEDAPDSVDDVDDLRVLGFTTVRVPL